MNDPTLPTSGGIHVPPPTEARPPAAEGPAQAAPAVEGPPSPPGLGSTQSPALAPALAPTLVDSPPPLGVTLVEGTTDTVEVPEAVCKTLGILNDKKEERVARAIVPARMRPLVLAGSTALDPTRLLRIRARFAPAEVMEIGQIEDPSLPMKDGKYRKRELRSGDWVKKGDLLGVFYSVDVGSKKNDLIDALVQLRLDVDILERAESANTTGAIPEVFLLNARRNVEGDHNAIARARNTLLTWGISKEDIAKVEEEAREIIKRGGQRDKAKEALWPRVELTAYVDGVIVERNVTQREMVVDNTINLFQIASVDRLLVVANAQEEELPNLLGLTSERRFWKVRPLTIGAKEKGIDGPIDDISYLIDVNQHAAVVKGHIDNPGKELRAGQYITATVQMPPPKNVVEVPLSALIDEGKQVLLFVQVDAAKHRYALRRVEVTHRFDKVAFVRSELRPEEQVLTQEEKDEGLLPRRPLRMGEVVLLSGALELKKGLLDELANNKN